MAGLDSAGRVKWIMTSVQKKKGYRSDVEGTNRWRAIANGAMVLKCHILIILNIFRERTIAQPQN